MGSPRVASTRQPRISLEELFHRPIDARDAVREIIADVRTGGDAALREWTYRIDGVDVETTRSDSAAMEFGMGWARTTRA